jgi:hypothetical protein
MINMYRCMVREGKGTRMAAEAPIVGRGRPNSTGEAAMGEGGGDST